MSEDPRLTTFLMVSMMEAKLEESTITGSNLDLTGSAVIHYDEALAEVPSLAERFKTTLVS